MVTAGCRPGNNLVACWAGLTGVHQADLVSFACRLCSDAQALPWCTAHASAA